MSILAYTPEDMTVSVTADTTLAELQQRLAQHGQWLPIDPPDPERVTLGKILNFDLSGPRRYGYGTVREHLIGIRVELPGGRTIQAGGNVVKNVAGYDLCKLFTGARGELGAVREATFKVRPLPECEQFVRTAFPTVEAAFDFVEKVDVSPLTPVVLDLHNNPWTVVVGFAGSREDVEWQRRGAAQFCPLAKADLDYDRRFWAEDAGQPVRRLSVLPSKLADAIQALAPVPASLVARAGNGVIYYRGGPEPTRVELPIKLMHRLKDEFDPGHKIPAA